MTRKLCAYCARWFEKETMTPLYEKGKDDFVLWYCEKCLPIVMRNIQSLHFKHLFRFGEKGGE